MMNSHTRTPITDAFCLENDLVTLASNADLLFAFQNTRYLHIHVLRTYNDIGEGYDFNYPSCVGASDPKLNVPSLATLKNDLQQVCFLLLFSCIEGLSV